jgi:hypothetical protein
VSCCRHLSLGSLCALRDLCGESVSSVRASAVVQRMVSLRSPSARPCGWVLALAGREAHRRGRRGTLREVSRIGWSTAVVASSPQALVRLFPQRLPRCHSAPSATSAVSLSPPYGLRQWFSEWSPSVPPPRALRLGFACGMRSTLQRTQRDAEGGVAKPCPTRRWESLVRRLSGFFPRGCDASSLWHPPRPLR